MGCTTTESSQQILDARDWYFGRRHCRSITFSDDTAGDQATAYFDINVINEDYEEVKHYAWLDNGSSVDPAIANKIGIQVTYTDNDSASTIALAFEAALATIEVNTENSGSVVEMENAFLGLIAVEDFSNAGDITLAINSAGFGGNLGAVASGGGSLSTEQALTEVTSDQTGSLILDNIVTGGSLSLELTIAELTTERWQTLIGNGYGDNYTKNLSDLTGYGSSKIYTSSFNYAAQLVGHPIRLPYSERSKDIVIWKTVASLNSINFSGTDLQSAEMSFVGLRDTSKPSEIDMFAYGDHSVI